MRDKIYYDRLLGMLLIANGLAMNFYTEMGMGLYLKTVHHTTIWWMAFCFIIAGMIMTHSPRPLPGVLCILISLGLHNIFAWAFAVDTGFFTPEIGVYLIVVTVMPVIAREVERPRRIVGAFVTMLGVAVIFYSQINTAAMFATHFSLPGWALGVLLALSGLVLIFGDKFNIPPYAEYGIFWLYLAMVFAASYGIVGPLGTLINLVPLLSVAYLIWRTPEVADGEQS